LSVFLLSHSRSASMTAMRNHTPNPDFVFVGFSEQKEVRAALFVVFLATYLTMLLGNLGTLVLIGWDAQLHTPMYFFLGSLSFLDICYSSTIAPRMLSDLLAGRKLISYSQCFTQLYFYAVFGTAECYLLAAMAYDRYLAICSPLLYATSMSSRVCVLLVAGSYLAGVLNASLHVAVVQRLSFCGPNLLDHFYCEGPPLQALSCSDTTLSKVLMLVAVSFNLFITILTILVSYACILATVLQLPSAGRKRKAFSTCISHLAVVTLSYGSLAFMYLGSRFRHSQKLDKVASVFYTLLTPTLNPLIYSLRNKEVKAALGRVVQRTCPPRM
ncbi:O1019 protein, partial [Indicator maculatus]|nr:O1019 protein [Indicator maculatus]